MGALTNGLNCGKNRHMAHTPALAPTEVASLCEMCGKCCVVPDDVPVGKKVYLGGDYQIHTSLVGANGACRYLSGPSANGNVRTCVIWGDPDRPIMCQLYPCKEDLDFLPDCPVTREAKERMAEHANQ